MTREDENSLVSVNLNISFNKITDRAVYKIENVDSCCPYPMDSKLPITSVYDVPAMHATYSPLYEMYAASDDLYVASDNAYYSLDEMHAASDDVYNALRNLDAFPDDRIVAALDERIAIAMDRKGSVDKVSKK